MKVGSTLTMNGTSDIYVVTAVTEGGVSMLPLAAAGEGSVIQKGDYVTISDQDGVFLVTGVYANGISAINVDGGVEGGWINDAATKVLSESLIADLTKAVNETIATKAKKWAYADPGVREHVINTLIKTLQEAGARHSEQDHGDGSRWDEI
jgi:hypothetical protein